VFIVHGEKEESEALAEYLKANLEYETCIPAIGESFLIKNNEIISQGLVKDVNKEMQLDEIVRGINRIKQKFSLLLNDMEFSGVDLDRETQYYNVKQKLDQLQKDIRKIKQMIRENELEV